MKPSKSAQIDIKDYYSIRVKSIWYGLKEESPAFWWLCIYFFFEYVRPQSIYPAINFIPWTQIALLGCLIYTFAEKRNKWFPNSQNNLIILLYFLVLLSCVFAFRPSVSWDKLNIPVNWLIAYFLIVFTLNTEKRFFVFVLLFLLASFKMSQHGFISYARRGFSYSNWGVAGAPGWFSNSGEFGIQMTIFVPLSIAFIASLRHYWQRWKRIFFYLFPFTGLMTIAATGSRGAQLAIAAVGVWFILKSRLGLKGLTGIILLGWLTYSVLPPEQLERFQDAGSDKTSEERLVHWEWGIDVANNHPITGIGYENWIYYCWYENKGGLGETGRCVEAHNIFVEAAAELGYPAVLIFLAMVLTIFIQNARTRKYARQIDNKFILNIAHGLDGGLIGYLVSGFFIAAFFYPFFWIQLSMSVALHEIARRKAHEKSASM